MIYVCMNLFVMMECKKIKTTVLGHFAKCCTRQRTPLPSAMVTAFGKAGKMGAENRFSSFAECCDHCARQRGPLPSATLGKVTQNGNFFFAFHHDKYIHTNIYHIYISSITYISHPSHIYLIHHIYISSIRPYHIHHNI